MRSALLWAAVPALSAHAQPIVYLSQQRGVSASVYAPACAPPDDAHWQQAATFQDFDADAHASRSCSAGSAAAYAQQQSSLTPGQPLHAHGEANAQVIAAAAPPRSQAASVFRVSIRLDAGAQLTTRGQLTAHTPGAAVAFVHLLDNYGATIALIQADPQDPTPHAVDDVRDLPPGVYALEVQAASEIDAPAPPGLAGEASFDITATFETRRCTPDFDGDHAPATDADIEAFFACLAGACCPACVGPDFNADGDAGTDADIESFFRVLAGEPC